MTFYTSIIDILSNNTTIIFLLIIAYASYLLYQKIMPLLAPIYPKSNFIIYYIVYYGQHDHKWYETLPEQPIYCNICKRIVLPYRESILNLI